MRVKQEHRSIEELFQLRDKIELNPIWQRGPAWKSPRQILLIDSILRDMDIPKIYLRKLNHGLFSHDVVDGQQRLRAIWMFRSDKINLIHPDGLYPIDGEEISGKIFSQLSQPLRERFDSFLLSIGEITSSSAEEVRNLFSRLQMGVSLNPAELRNAMEGPLRYSIDSTARLHPFFIGSRISKDRFKHLDYAAHAYAAAAYGDTNDMKAPNLRAMIAEYGADRGAEVLALSARVDKALDVLKEINELLGLSITQKWIFVDLIWFIMQRQDSGLEPDPVAMARKFQRFESLRRAYNSHAESLLQSGQHPDVPKALSQYLYDYIGAFRTQGGLRSSLTIRNRAIRAFLR
jgi:Protein of unknown function DUF262